MPQFQRAQAQGLCDLQEASPKFMAAFFGPRRTGKTTIVRQALERTKMPGRLLPIDSLKQPPLRHPPNVPRSPTLISPPRSTEWSPTLTAGKAASRGEPLLLTPAGCQGPETVK